MKKRVLLSIHPEHAEAILAGRKRYEFRKVRFREVVDEVVIYATSPVCRVVGTFEVEEIYSAHPDAVWTRAREVSGISRELFRDYFRDRKLAHAIKVSNPVRFARARLLGGYLESNVPPQSFCYL
ncbi:ASCH domain-containing protein [Pseudorhodoferax sp. Leaf267]|uniref:ASCH domain-containing protein n=1 Tax=Pseudorhodoferax sp. Leaf267 TaxID=1736316 RepID=UPI0009EAA7CB|nr:ASCH domain-containing protein [Pseudorhodoferax sp. Leaf267]